jgi:putative ABC transport system permease protein
MQGVWRDLTYGLRGLRREPGFTLLAMLTLALGIGASTTIFSVIQNVLLDPFPYTDAERVVQIQIHNNENARPGGRTFFQPGEFLDYQEQPGVFEEVIGGTMEDVLYTTAEGTELWVGGKVTGNTFRFLGVPAALGRGIGEEDAKAGAPPVFVLSHKAWVKYFNQDPAVVGQTYVLNGAPKTLVGIMPSRFTKLGADIWTPFEMTRADAAISRQYFMFQARLKPGVSTERAQAAVDTVARRLAAEYPQNYPKNFSVNITSWVDSLVGQFRTTLYTLAAAVGLLLLIACSNVANMLLARGSARERELAIRASMGASRARLVRQLLVESFLLALGGAALGCAFSWGGIQALVTLIPDGLIPREAVIRLNVPALLFSLGAAVLTAILFGLAPSLQSVGRNLTAPLKESGRGVSGGFRRGRLRNALVVSEVALSLLLLTGAGLLMRSFIALQTVELGLNADNVLSARLPLPRGQYNTAEAKHRFFRQLLQRVEALPGVVAASETSTLPPYGGIGTEIDIPGKTHTERWEAIFQLCSEGYFPTLGLQLQRGRLLTDVEVNDARKVAVVNQTLVTKYFPQEDPIGQRIKLNMLENFPESPVPDPVFEIVGVVADAKNSGIRDPVRPELFIPYTVTGAFERGILVRAAGDATALLPALRREIWAVDRGVALTLVGTLTDYLSQFSYAEPRFSLVLLAVFAGVGLVLVAIGVYSTIAYTVSRQTQEIGVRIALGASPGAVMRMVIGMGSRMLAVGVVVGVLASLAATRILESQLWGVSKYDPVTLAGVVVVLAVAGLSACYFPARRATRVDPIVALRCE